MFDYLKNEYNPEPHLVVDLSPPADGRIVAHLPYATSVVLDVPADDAALRAAHGAKYWSTLRRKERLFNERFGTLVFRVLSDADGVRAGLPAAQSLFRERWADEYTSLPWKDDIGFRQYADALVAMAADGRAELVLLEGDDKPLAFACCLLDGDWYYFFQHATTTDPAYRAYSVGKLLVAKLVADLVARPRARHLDFMIGDNGYKREWESTRRTVYQRLEERATVSGALRLGARVVGQQFTLQIRFRNPLLRRVAKWVLLRREQVSLPRPSGEHHVAAA